MLKQGDAVVRYAKRRIRSMSSREDAYLAKGIGSSRQIGQAEVIVESTKDKDRMRLERATEESPEGRKLHIRKGPGGGTTSGPRANDVRAVDQEIGTTSINQVSGNRDKRKEKRGDAGRMAHLHVSTEKSRCGMGVLPRGIGTTVRPGETDLSDNLDRPDGVHGGGGGGHKPSTRSTESLTHIAGLKGSGRQHQSRRVGAGSIRQGEVVHLEGSSGGGDRGDGEDLTLARRGEGGMLRTEIPGQAVRRIAAVEALHMQVTGHMDRPPRDGRLRDNSVEGRTDLA